MMLRFIPGFLAFNQGHFIHAFGKAVLFALLLFTPVFHLWQEAGVASGTERVVAYLIWTSCFIALVFLSSRETDAQAQKLSPLRDTLKQFNRSSAGLFGAYTAMLIFILAALTPIVAPHHPNILDAGPQLAAPSFQHWMGTDEFGRDLLSRVLFGTRISLMIGLFAVSLSATLGTLVGAVSGYFGGAIDRVAMWLVDLLLSLPRLVLLLAVVGFFRAAGAQSLALIVVILGLTGWMGVSRIVRASVLSLKEQEYIQAARALGLPTFRIIWRHIIPNALAPVIVHASLAIGATVLVEAALTFLGLGVPPPTPTWGAIVNDGREYMRTAPWISIFPGLCIVVSVMAFNLLGDGFRDALDPKLRGRK